MKKRTPLTFRDYNTGHPWYYLLGGTVRTLRQIKDDTAYSGYKGYRADEIAKADSKAEPKRSATLRKIRAEVVENMREDITIYRQRALELHQWRKAHPLTDTPECSVEIHTSMSLKHNHLVNGFAHLIFIDACLEVQRDLFGD